MNRRTFLKHSALVGTSSALIQLADCATAEPSSSRIHTIDMTYTLHLNPEDLSQRRQIWDDAHVMAALQGLVNRETAELYQFFVGDQTGTLDHYWLDWMSEKNNWLGHRKQIKSHSIRSMVMRYRHLVKGLVVYDENVPATSNVASTAAGVEDLLPVRYDSSLDSLYNWLTLDPDGPMFEVGVWLVHPDGSPLFTGSGLIPGSATSSTNSSKCDAYIWAKERYLDTGRCNPTKMGFYIDAYWLQKPFGYIPNHTLSNHDYFIAHRGFFWDLSPWAQEKPIDDPTQPFGTDQTTLKAILHSAWMQTHGKRMIHIGGFIPWDKKYTDLAGGEHGGVATEWQMAYIISSYNAYLDADALGLGAMANASFFQHYPLNKSYTQVLPSEQQLHQKYSEGIHNVTETSFVTFYVGDYDSAAWLYQKLPSIWNDTARGSIPLGWAFNPNLSERFAPGMVYVRETKTPNDHFISGDSGAGYINPGALQEPRKFSGLPSGIDTWRRHCQKYYHLWDIELTGFIIDGDAPAMDSAVKDAYASFSPRGIVAQKIPQHGMWKSMPFIRMTSDIGGSPEDVAKLIISQTSKSGLQFRIYRSVLQTPSWHKRVIDLLKASEHGDRIEVLDPYSLMLLLQQNSRSEAS